MEMRVRLPHLPLRFSLVLCASMVKGKSRPASNGVFQVQILVGVLTVLWCSWCSGFCTPGCEPGSIGSTPFEHPLRQMTNLEIRMTKSEFDVISLVTCTSFVLRHSFDIRF